MARTESAILELLAKKPDGLEFAEIYQELDGGDGLLSQRGVRNLLNQMVKDGTLVKLKKRRTKGRGAPPNLYIRPDTLPRQLNIFDNIPGVDPEKSRVVSRTEIDKEELTRDERKRQETAKMLLKGLDSNESKAEDKDPSALERIATSHLQAENYAKAIIAIAPQFAEENPVDVIVKMAAWVVNDLNKLAEEIQRELTVGNTEKVNKLTARLNERLIWTRNYFQRFWRFDRSLDDLPGILDLPRQAKHFYRDGQRACLDEDAARSKLRDRILNEKFINELPLPTNKHKAVAGTDASVSDIWLVHSPGSFIPPDPIVLTSSAAAMVVTTEDTTKQEYNDFDIFPDQLKEYEDYNAAVNGLLLSPELMRPLGASDFKHSRMAAMELRQYEEDVRVCMRKVDWRYAGNRAGDRPPKPTIIFRDGRVFPIVHRLNFYEADSLYGQIVRNQIERFADAILNTMSSPTGQIIYGSAVKNPELSWLAPIAFWYLHVRQSETGVKVDADDVYKSPFADTAISHLLFLGVAKDRKHFASDRLFVISPVVRRFSDIALVETSLPAAISESDRLRLVEEGNIDDWREYISQRLDKKRENLEENILELDDYEPFLYSCAKAGVLMCYAAPTVAYESIVSGVGAGHFLIPRLEVAINVEGNQTPQRKNLEQMLSWLVAENWFRDGQHTQSGFQRTDTSSNFPILIPEVTYLAHEAATFARDKLSEEIQDEIRALIAELRKRVERRN